MSYKNLVLVFLLFAVVSNFNSLAVKTITIITLYENKPFHDLLNTMAIENTTCRETNDESKKCVFFKIHDVNAHVNKNEKAVFILTEILKKMGKSLHDVCIVDVFDFKGSYFPSAHTDLEWETFHNADGFQVWYLDSNNDENNHGNMFVLDNEYLYKKYHNKPFFLRKKNKEIQVIRNIPDNVTWQKDIYEVIHEEEFKRTTKVKYLDFKAGNCLVFKKNVMHMSDYRGRNFDRRAINFRVIFRNADGSINFSKNTVRSKVKMHHYYDETNSKLFNVGLLDFA